MRTITALLGLAILLSLGWGQANYGACLCPEAENPLDNVSEDYNQVEVENGVIGAVIGLTGTINWDRICYWDLGSGNCVTLNAAGSVQLGTLNGSALLGGNDDFYALTSGYFVVRGLTRLFPFGAAYPGGIFFTLDIDGSQQVWGDSLGERDVSWRGASGSYCARIWRRGDIETELRIELIQTVFRITMKVKNVGTTAHSVGLRFASDVEHGAERDLTRDDAPYVYLSSGRPITIDTDLRGLEIPPAIEIYNTRSDLVAASRYILAPMPGFPDATRVDRLTIGKWYFLMATSIWEPFLFPDSPFSDAALLMFYNPRRLEPGQEFTFVMYVTLATTVVDVERPMGVGVETWPILNFDAGGLNGLKENPFPVFCNITNQYSEVGREVELQNVRAFISLPPGLRLAKKGDQFEGNPLKADETPTKEVGTIAPNQTVSVRWIVVAEGEVIGPVPIRVKVSASPAPAKTVERTLIISATNLRRYERGFQLVSIPFQTSASLSEVLSDLEGNLVRKRRWDPERQMYMDFEQISPGFGFWLYLRNPQTAQLHEVTPIATRFNQGYTITLFKGWNQIGNPYPEPVAWGQLAVLAGDFKKSLTLQEAVQRGILRGVLYYWDEFSQEYKFTSDLSTLLFPHRGYWVKVNESMQLSFPSILLPGTGQTGGTRAAKPEPITRNNWRLQLVARTANAVDTQNFVGVAPNASAGIDPLDVEAPPPAEESLQLALLPAPNISTDYMQLLRSPSDARLEYEFTVRSKPGEEVTLQWPNLKQMPKEYTFRLVDQQTRQTISLHTTSEYRYRSSGTHWFKLIAQRRMRGSALITNLNISPAGRGSRTVSITYSLASDALTEVRILELNGRQVASLAKGRAATRGVNTAIWNLSDNAGRKVPPGSYLAEVIAITPEGNRVRAAKPFVVAR